MAAEHDPTRGDDHIRAVRTALLDGRHDQVRDGLRAVAVEDAEALWAGVADGLDAGAAVARWLEREPEDPDALLLMAVHRVEQLPWLRWRIQATREDSRPDEIAWVEKAVAITQWVLKRHPDHDIGWVWLASAVGALGFLGTAPVEDVERITDRALDTVPTAVRPLRWRIRAQDPAGDPQVGVRVARGIVDQLGPGDPRRAEIATAHIQVYLNTLEHDEQAALALWNDEVAAELVAAGAGIDGRTDAVTVDAINLLAFTLPRTPQAKQARGWFDRLDGRFVTWPWALLRQPAEAYDELRSRTRSRWR
jgi:hypothetical protein